jgi:RHS repeat-associated protein
VHVTHLDSLGRAFLSIEDNGGGQTFATRQAFDIEGNVRSVTDARGNLASESVHDLVSSAIRQTSIDSGTRRTLANVADKPIRQWDSRGYATQTVYDPLLRAIEVRVAPPGGPTYLAERMMFGDSPNTGLTPAATLAANLRTKLYRTFDQAGLVTNERYDYKGNLIRSVRRLAETHAGRIDWAANPTPTLLQESFAVESAYDALQRAFLVTTPDDSVVHSLFDESNHLREARVSVRGAAEAPYVADIRYDASGRRMAIEYGNGAVTTYDYDLLSDRLTNLQTTRPTVAGALQDLAYAYDPVGNVTGIVDAAQQTIYFDNAVVDAGATYRYDPTYRIVEAKGREHIGQAFAPDGLRPFYDPNDRSRTGLPHPNDGAAMRRYTERYEYDSVGNLTLMAHSVAGPGTWSRRYTYPAGSNRLDGTTLPGDPGAGPLPIRYTYDDAGNIASMPHLPRLDWDHAGSLQEVQLDGQRIAYYRYDGTGRRIRKLVEQNGVVVEERIYLGGFEVHRRHVAGALRLERQTLHVMDGQQRIALVETKTVDAVDNATLLVPFIRYQIGNHLGSVALELGGAAGAPIISYEEFYPYGGTAYQAGTAALDASPKRYGHDGHERDEETGFYYHGARYRAPWLGRWVSCDPLGHADAPNPYAFTRNNPIRLVDPGGTLSWGAIAGITAAIVVGTVLTVATAGLAGPVVGTAAAAIIGGIVGGAAGGAVGAAVESKIDTGHVDTGAVIRGAVVGGVVGGAIAAAGVGVAAAAGTAVGRAIVNRVASSAVGRLATAGAERVGASFVGSASRAVGRGLERFVGAPMRRLGEAAVRRLGGTAAARGAASEAAAQQAADRAAASRLNVQGREGIGREIEPAGDRVFRHSTMRSQMGPGVAAEQIRLGGAGHSSPGGQVGQWGEGFYAYEGPIPQGSSAPQLEFRVPPETAAERITIPGQDPIIRLVPPAGRDVPVRIIGSNISIGPDAQRMARILTAGPRVPFDYPGTIPPPPIGSALLGGAAGQALGPDERGPGFLMVQPFSW